MDNDQLDRVLSEELDLTPSSGFASAVMDAVHMEASAPPPIPFPWRRAMPGIVAFATAMVALLISAVGRTAEAASEPTTLGKVASSVSGLLRAAGSAGSGWIVGALLLTYISIKLSMLATRERV